MSFFPRNGGNQPENKMYKIKANEALSRKMK